MVQPLVCLANFYSLPYKSWASLVAQMVKRLPAMQETWVWSLGQEDPLEKEMETHSSILAWKIPWTEEPGGPQSMGSQKVGHNWVTNTHTHTHTHVYMYVINAVSQFSCSVVSDSATPWTAAHQASLYITYSWSLLKLMSIESVKPSNHLILCRPHPFQPSIFASIRVFFSESVLPIRWPNYWSFSFSICLSDEYSGLISFRMD